MELWNFSSRRHLPRKGPLTHRRQLSTVIKRQLGTDAPATSPDYHAITLSTRNT